MTTTTQSLKAHPYYFGQSVVVRVRFSNHDVNRLYKYLIEREAMLRMELDQFAGDQLAVQFKRGDLESVERMLLWMCSNLSNMSESEIESAEDFQEKTKETKARKKRGARGKTKHGVDITKPLTPREEMCWRMRETGMSVREIAEHYQVPKIRIKKVLRRVNRHIEYKALRGEPVPDVKPKQLSIPCGLCERTSEQVLSRPFSGKVKGKCSACGLPLFTSGSY